MKKESSDSSIGDLLKKLQSTYMGGKKADKPEKKSKSDEADDGGLLAQLKATLDKVSKPEAKEKKHPKKASTPKISEKAEIQESPTEAVEEPIVEVVEEPVVEVVEEPVVEAVEEPVVEAVEEPVVEAVEEPIVETVEEPIVKEPPKRAIKVTVKQIPVEEAPKTAPDAPKTPEPIVIKPKSTSAAIVIPRSSGEHDFAKNKAEKPNDTIVIRPKTARKNPSEPIVIRPRSEDARTVRPKPVTREPLAETHIKIKTMQNNNDKIESVSPVETPNVSLPKSTQNDFLIEKDEPVQEKAPSAAEKADKPRVTAVPISPDDPFLKDASAKEIADPPIKEFSPETIREPVASAPMEEVAADAPEVATESKKTSKKTLFRTRRKAKKQSEEANAELSPMEQISKKSGLTSDDVDMMFELGYENELGRLVGYETMKKLRYEYLRRNSQSEHRHYRTAFGYRGEEYIKAEQNEKVLSAYAHDKKQLTQRVFFTALLSFLLFFLDLPQLTGASLAELDQTAPLLFPILSLLALIGASYFSYRQLYAGLRSFLRFTPTPYSIASVTVPTVILYSLLAMIPAVNAPIPANFLASLLLLTMAIGDVFRLTGELRAFRIVSSAADKTVLEPAAPRKRQLRQGNKIVKVINDEIDDNLYRVRNADQTTGFFRRFNALQFAARPILLTLGCAFSISLLSAFVTALVTKSFGGALSAFITMLLFCMPFSMIFHAFYPMNRVNSVLYRRNCTLVGEESAEEYAEDQTLIFSDNDLYNAEKCAQISVREGDELRRDLRLTEILLRKLGGTLGRLALTVRKAEDDEVSVSVVRIAQNGIEAVVDTQYHVLLGSADFLRRSGIRVPRESSDAEMSRTPDVSVMHVAIGGVLKLTYELKYASDDKMEDILTMIASNGTSVAIQSYDPNLTDEFLALCRPEHLETVTVIRPGRFEADTVQEVVDTGAVALGSRANVALPIHAAKHLDKTRRRGYLLQLATSAAGILFAILVTALIPKAGIVPPLIALYHVASCAIAIINTRLSLNNFTLNS